MSGQIPIYAVVRVQNPPFWHGRSQLGHGGRSSPAAGSRCAAGAGLEGPPEHQAIIQAARMQLTPTLSVKSSSGFYNSTGLRLCGPGEWLVEKHGARRRRAWRKLHIGVDAETGQIL